jgi:hypothetical protein
MSRLLTYGILNQRRPAPPVPLLLDLYPAAYAISKRRLKAGSNDVIRLRESLNSNEINLTQSQITDGTAAVFVGSNDGLVVKYNNAQNPAANPMQQLVVASQGKLFNAGNLILANTKPALQIASGVLYSSGSLTQITQPYTAMLVFETGDLSGFQPIIQGSNSATNYLFATNGTTILARLGGGGQALASNLQQNTQYLLTLVADGANTTLYLNGQFSVTNNPGTSGITELRINHGNSFNGKFQELIVFAGDQSVNRATIEGNINAYYNVY